MLDRWESLVPSWAQRVARFDREEREILDELLSHGRRFGPSDRLPRCWDAPVFSPLIARLWRRDAGVSQEPARFARVHRSTTKKSPRAWKAFATSKTGPKVALTDAFGALRAVQFERRRRKRRALQRNGRSGRAGGADALHRGGHKPQHDV